MKLFKDTESAYAQSSSQNQRLVDNPLAHLVSMILTMCVLFLALHQIATAQTIHIPDPNLRAALESALGKEADADITRAEMASLESLDAFESGILDLTGLEFAINLTELHLGLNRISDVSLLKGLAKLTVLDLHRNQRISDVSPLRGLTNLTWLSLRGNRISDVSPLKTLINLIYLHLGYNQILDVSPLKTLTNLTFLNLDANRISDVSPLSVLTNLINLALDDNQISNVLPLGVLTNLKFLNLNDNRKISDLSPLSVLTNLKFIDLHGNEISDVSPLKNLTNLTNLRLQENQISDVSPLKDLVNLTVLDLHDNHISDFSPIAGLIENLVEYDASDQTVPSPKAADVNRDGVVNILDLVLLASNYADPDLAALAGLNIYPDVNSDGIVDIRDLVSVAAEMGSAAAPTLSKNSVDTSNLTTEHLAQWIQLAKQLDTYDPHTQKGITVLEQLLAAMMSAEVLPKGTVLLANYPNPFNPETWIPYQLAKPAAVNISIHSSDGKLVRTLRLGHLPAGEYQRKSRAAYWDGRNALGESVASGVYFYTLIAGDFTATGKMLIRK